MAEERLQVKQLRYASDNLGYLIYGQKFGIRSCHFYAPRRGILP
jgi:hypothetical protein